MFIFDLVGENYHYRTHNPKVGGSIVQCARMRAQSQCFVLKRDCRPSKIGDNQSSPRYNEKAHFLWAFFIFLAEDNPAHLSNKLYNDA